MSKKSKSIRLNHTQKLLQIMVSGNVVTHEEIESRIGDQIQMYKISTYIWAIKTKMGGIIRVIKSGRKVSGYQLINVVELKSYMKRIGIPEIDPAPIKTLSDLNAIPEVSISASEVPVLS